MRSSPLKVLKWVMSIKFLSYRFTNTLVVFIVLMLFFYFFTPHHIFVNPRNIRALSKFIPEIGIVTLGIGMLMICGEFDLSVGSVLPLCAFIFISLLKNGMNPFFSLLIVFAAGALLGLLNGLITVKGYIPSFITTLGTMMLWRGVTLLLSRGYTSPFNPAVSPLFCHILTGKIGGFIPVQVIWFAIVGLILGFLLHSHKFGNWVYATGDNKLAARAMGINTDGVKIICFMIVGILCAFVGVMQVVRVSSFFSRAGEGWELKAIAASVVGGTALMGGIGSMVGIFLGALIIEFLENGLILMRVPVFGISAFIGLAIILFVLLNAYIERKRIGK